MEAVRRCEKEIKGLKSDVSDSKKQSTKALKKVEALERDVRQIRALLEGREAGSGASFKPRLSDESDTRQQVGFLLCMLDLRLCMHGCSLGNLIPRPP